MKKKSLNTMLLGCRSHGEWNKPSVCTASWGTAAASSTKMKEDQRHWTHAVSDHIGNQLQLPSSPPPTSNDGQVNNNALLVPPFFCLTGSSHSTSRKKKWNFILPFFYSNHFHSINSKYQSTIFIFIYSSIHEKITIIK